MLRVYLQPSEEIPEYERLAEIMYFFTGSIPQAYYDLVLGDPFLAVTPDSSAENISEFLQKRQTLEKECAEIVKEFVGEYLRTH
ncbi:hypothetical protein GF358_04190 [Candidatus Woesearchaeota archaeon]|nr:hypothetical protein [Candidatus Woesearchaeota archaeon]